MTRISHLIKKTHAPWKLIVLDFLNDSNTNVRQFHDILISSTCNLCKLMRSTQHVSTFNKNKVISLQYLCTCCTFRISKVL